MLDSKSEDSSWQTAMDWLMRENESELSHEEALALKTWLTSDSAHHQAYMQAKTTWLGACFISTDILKSE